MTAGLGAPFGLVADFAGVAAARVLTHAGADIPPPPSVGSLLGDWHLQLLPVLGIGIVAGLYLAGVLRLKRRGVSWSPWRTAAWLFGLALLAGALMSGLDVYADLTFSAHAVQHMFLVTVAPIPLCLGAPLTLALRALSPRPRRVLVRILHTRLAQFFAFPLTGFVLMTFSLYAVYYTSLYPASIENPTLHEWLHVHFLVSGCLFYWPIIGIDPIPGRLPYWGRLLFLFLSLPVHALFGVSLMSTPTVFAADYYAELHVPWVTSALADQHTGGAIMWAAGELVGWAVFSILVVQWARADEREARRTDRRLDREAAANRRTVTAAAGAPGTVAAGSVGTREGGEASDAAEAVPTGALAAYNARLAALARADTAHQAALAEGQRQRMARKAAARGRVRARSG